MKVTLGLAALTHEQLVTKGQEIHDAMVLAAATFNAPVPTMAALLVLVNNLRNAIIARVAADAAATTAVQLEKDAADALAGGLTQEGTYVDGKALGVAAVILLAGMGVRKAAAAVGPMPKVLNLKLTTSDIHGALDWMCKPTPGVRVYILQICTGDPAVEANWHYSDTQTASRGTLKNLPSGNVWVRVLAKGADEDPGPPSDPAEEIVH
jgi:hypothetical protein